MSLGEQLSDFCVFSKWGPQMGVSLGDYDPSRVSSPFQFFNRSAGEARYSRTDSESTNNAPGCLRLWGAYRWGAVECSLDLVTFFENNDRNNCKRL
jgi:hypothetical protein